MTSVSHRQGADSSPVILLLDTGQGKNFSRQARLVMHHSHEAPTEGSTKILDSHGWLCMFPRR